MPSPACSGEDGVGWGAGGRKKKKAVDKMEVTHSGCRVGMKGHEEKPHSAGEKDTLMQKASASRLSVSSGSWRRDGRDELFIPGLQKQRY